MTVDAAISAAFDRVSARQRDAMRAFTPGATPENDDVAEKTVAEFTLDPLSVVPPEGDYFVVSGQRGTRSYTHDGSMAIRDGRLVDASGQPVLGSTHDGATLAPISIDPIDLALHRCEGLRIDADGSLAYRRTTIDPRTGARIAERVIAGRLALARFPAGTAPLPKDALHVGAPHDVLPHVGVAGDGAFGTLLPMHRSGASIDIDASLTKLREAYIALDALRAARAADGSVAKTTMDLLK
ncbi:MAG TPA: hypothetical protein VIJ12_00560 [Candidatus Baltobacteraceae bacterium]